jgi:hypothetical protein
MTTIPIDAAELRWEVLEQNNWGYDMGLSEYHWKAGILLNRRSRY